jgi:thiamine pyrophosphokinase
VIIGDLDSISEEAQARHASILIRDEDQENNDLTKAVYYCMEEGYVSVSILGATGLREDHTLGNISLMLEYFPGIELRIISDFGSFFLVESGQQVKCRTGDRISIFSVDNRVRVKASGLKYPLENLELSNWYRASLNEATSDKFTLHFASDLPLIVYKAWG